jgi:hypothetical protein
VLGASTLFQPDLSGNGGAVNHRKWLRLQGIALVMSCQVWMVGCTAGTQSGGAATGTTGGGSASGETMGAGTAGRNDTTGAESGGTGRTSEGGAGAPFGTPMGSGSGDLPTGGNGGNGGNGGSGGGLVGDAAIGAEDARAIGADASRTADSGAGGSSSTGNVWSGTLPKFTKHTIASFSAGYTTVIVDIDHDGLPDVVALSSGSDGLVWFKNPSWKKFTITNRARQLIFVAPYDVDGDGHVDVAIASDFDTNNTASGGTISWAQAPTDPTQSEDWTLHKIDAIPTTHRLRWGDIDGDGKKELIALPIFGEGSSAPAHQGPVQLKAYFIPATPRDAQATWRSQVLDETHLEVSHGLRVVDWDGDKAEDLLTAANDGIDLFRPSLGKGAEHLGAGASGQAPNKGSSDVVLGKLGGDRFIATIDYWHGTDAVIYTPGASASALWNRQVIGSDFQHGHGLVAVDLNHDGYDEVIGGGGEGAMNQVIYRYVPSSRSWDKIMLDSGTVAVSEIDAQDMNGDGAVDIVTIGASPTNNVVWYESSR